MQVTRVLAGLILSLMIFSQSVLAVSAPCSSMASAAESVATDMGPDSHAGHHMKADVKEDQGDSCCDGGYCSVSGCLSLVAVFSPDTPVSLAVSGGAIGQSVHASPTTHRESLYRPPIVV